MKALSIFLLLALCTALTGCQAVEGIFKAGVWVGILVVGGIIGLIVFLIGRR